MHGLTVQTGCWRCVIHPQSAESGLSFRQERTFSPTSPKQDSCHTISIGNSENELRLWLTIRSSDPNTSNTCCTAMDPCLTCELAGCFAREFFPYLIVASQIRPLSFHLLIDPMIVGWSEQVVDLGCRRRTSGRYRISSPACTFQDTRRRHQSGVHKGKRERSLPSTTSLHLF